MSILTYQGGCDEIKPCKHAKYKYSNTHDGTFFFGHNLDIFEITVAELPSDLLQNS